MAFEQGQRQPCPRLIQRHVIRAGRDRMFAHFLADRVGGLDFGCSGDTAHLDAVAQQYLREARRPRGPLAFQQEERPDRPGLAELDAVGDVRVEIDEQVMPILGRRFERGQSADVVMAHAVVIVELGLIVACDDAAAHAGLLPEDADGPVQDRPGRAVLRAEAVEHLACRVSEAVAIEVLRVVAADLHMPVLLPAERMRIVRVGRRVEEERAVSPHLVGIDEDLRLPAQKSRDAGLRFALRLQIPVAVHVEEIVIDAPARPKRFRRSEAIGDSWSKPPPSRDGSG